MALNRCPPPVLRMCKSHNRGEFDGIRRARKLHDVMRYDARLGENHAMFFWGQRADFRGGGKLNLNTTSQKYKINNFHFLIAKKISNAQNETHNSNDVEIALSSDYGFRLMTLKKNGNIGRKQNLETTCYTKNSRNSLKRKTSQLSHTEGGDSFHSVSIQF